MDDNNLVVRVENIPATVGDVTLSGVRTEDDTGHTPE